jgi:hypothetical protein
MRKNDDNRPKSRKLLKEPVVKPLENRCSEEKLKEKEIKAGTGN